MKQICALLLFLGIGTGIFAQCTLLPNATTGLTLTQQGTNHSNNSGVAYNPNLSLYYGVRAGNPVFPLDTWNSIGTQLYQTTAGFDWRGMWWNPTTNQLEGNGYASSGIWKCDLNGTGYALNTGATIFPGQNQPDAQSCGDLDWQANQILYYYNGAIYKYSRATNAFIGSIPITGTPVAIGNLNSTSLCFTGCSGMEVALLDYVNKRVYLYNKATGVYSGTSQLPGAAVTSTSFKTSWANGFIWLFNTSNYTWYSYNIFSPVLAVNLFEFDAHLADANTVVVSWKIEDESDLLKYQVERSVDGFSFSPVGPESSPAGTFPTHYQMTDLQFPKQGMLYYRLKMKLEDGSFAFSEIATVALENMSSDFVSVFPCPANDLLTVCVNAIENSIIQIQIMDVMGKCVISETHTSQQVVDCSNLNISGLPSGTYFLKIDSNGKLFHQKIVVAE